MPETLDIRTESGSIVIAVKVTPRASRSRVQGVHGGVLKVALSAPPVDGAANEALIELFADLVDVPKRNIEIVSGHASRSKRVRILGVSRAELLTKLSLG